ncbi:hypothetical protein CE91St44_33540 [Oscillospiraceae bacterium]|nr:hypothetical protein CE91St44_33540 [Oscillospiraceae bacterium]
MQQAGQAGGLAAIGKLGVLQHRRSLQRQAGAAVSGDLRGRQAPRDEGEKSKIARHKTQRRQQKQGAARHNAKAQQGPREGKPPRRATGCKAWFAAGMGRRAGHCIGMRGRAAHSAPGGRGVPGMGGANATYSHSTSPLSFYMTPAGEHPLQAKYKKKERTK